MEWGKYMLNWWLIFVSTLSVLRASLMAQTIKRLPAMQETRVQFLGWEDPLEKEMAIHSNTLAWKIPWTEEPDRLQSMWSQRVRHNWMTSLSLYQFDLIQVRWNQHKISQSLFPIHKFWITLSFLFIYLPLQSLYVNKGPR